MTYELNKTSDKNVSFSPLLFLSQPKGLFYLQLSVFYKEYYKKIQIIVDGEVHRAKSRKILSEEASVHMELGYAQKLKNLVQYFIF